MNREYQVLIDPVKQQLTALQSGMVRTLLYFDVFNYPLKKTELYKYCQSLINSTDEFNAALDFLVCEKFIKHSHDFYFINDDHSILERRIFGNELAKKYNLIAKKYSRLISKFPFVKAVFISGSLSKGYMDKDSDIDYFIITEPGRLWLCRTLLVLFKKVFLLNSHKYFCVNYFIDDEHLEIPDKNIFTATELVTLMPMVNHYLFKKFTEANRWVLEYLPNVSANYYEILTEKQKPLMKKLMEKIFRNRFGDKLDAHCLKATLQYWRKKFKNFNEHDFKNALRSRRDVSKHHPNKFQEKVLALYGKKIMNFEKKYFVYLLSLHELSASLFQ
jgi:predicted nucleotidyltransferase